MVIYGVNMIKMLSVKKLERRGDRHWRTAPIQPHPSPPLPPPGPPCSLKRPKQMAGNSEAGVTAHKSYEPAVM